jgi:hypothetical protein
MTCNELPKWYIIKTVNDIETERWTLEECECDEDGMECIGCCEYSNNERYTLYREDESGTTPIGYIGKEPDEKELHRDQKVLF